MYWKLVIPISLCASATLAEVFRASVLALPRGQFEAAASAGMTGSHSCRLVILPQAVLARRRSGGGFTQILPARFGQARRTPA